MSDPTTGLNIKCLPHLLTAVSSLPQYGVDEHLRVVEVVQRYVAGAVGW